MKPNPFDRRAARQLDHTRRVSRRVIAGCVLIVLGAIVYAAVRLM